MGREHLKPPPRRKLCNPCGQDHDPGEMCPHDYKPKSVTEEIDHPPHYTAHPSGVECIQIIEHMTYNVGSVFKYLWRAGLKDGNPALKDLRKARWFINREITRLQIEEE